ncbi:MAG: hypothetical protein OQJ84_09680 [Xanthomonadales bacterium]|nr:hypothetical protein [Xanthomonadales bacterium]
MTTVIKWLAAILITFANPIVGRTDTACKGVDLLLDTSSARTILNIIAGHGGSQAIASALKLPGNVALVRKTHEFGRNVSVGDLGRALSVLQAGETLAKDSFGLNRLKEKSEDAEALLALFERDHDKLLKGVCEYMSPYLPDDYREQMTIRVLAGGYATGFTFEGETDFYIAAHNIGDDPAGLQLILIHELFHIVQAARSPLQVAELEAIRDKNLTRGNALAHLFNGYLEGGATYVADPAEFEGEGPTVMFFKDSLNKNMKVIRRHFITFEAYLYQLFNDPDADADAIYAAGFYDDGPMYFVGYYMAKKLEEKYGGEKIRAMLDQHPSRFYLDYIAICRANDDLLCFSKRAESIIRETMG